MLLQRATRGILRSPGWQGATLAIFGPATTHKNKNKNKNNNTKAPCCADSSHTPHTSPASHTSPSDAHSPIFAANRAWAASQRARDPAFFARLAAGQAPTHLWLGCSDSRIPAEVVAGLAPGEAFVHRNIANLVCAGDLNAMGVIEYAVRHLAVRHIVVCGHYGCGGVKAAMEPRDLGILNPWLRNIRDVYRLHERELDAMGEGEARYDRLVELNVVEQCRNVVKTAVVQQSYADKGFPLVHGWVFNFRDGLLKDLEIDFPAMLKRVQKIYNLTGSKP
ncbi:hypothetical protein P8C59_008382 [Phyllachora maydis]|uniref:Carbonic anhydrase n=1 Tax=Phyllachora maydis TaxID=1825666 RepID=A0AAD9IAG9_9PEZI|nr:hypothetical protein P8C59_008382 [Phyllachora maydis]